MGHAIPTPSPSPQILDSEPLMEVHPLCWCVGREELKIVKCELCPDQFLISQTRKWRFREGKGLTQCHMIWFDEMSVGLGIGSLTSANNWCTGLCYAHCPMPSLQVPGNAVVPRAILPPNLDSSRDERILVLWDNTHTHCSYLKACSVGSSLRPGMSGICLDSYEATVPPGL